MNNYNFREAKIAEAEPIVFLINSAYRGESSRLGWTTEADLLAGLRTNVTNILTLIADKNSKLLICEYQKILVGSVLIQMHEQQLIIGMLAVSPSYQGKGIGKQLLAFAEFTAWQTWAVRRFLMYVIPLRHELVAFYERRGYQRTGLYQRFPENPTMWMPKVTNLHLELLEKNI